MDSRTPLFTFFSTIADTDTTILADGLVEDDYLDLCSQHASFKNASLNTSEVDGHSECLSPCSQLNSVIGFSQDDSGLAAVEPNRPVIPGTCKRRNGEPLSFIEGHSKKDTIPKKVPPLEMQIRFLRVGLERGLLTKEEKPLAKNMPSVDFWLSELEKLAIPPEAVIRKTKLRLVLRKIQNLEIPDDDKFYIRTRAEGLRQKWAIQTRRKKEALRDESMTRDDKMIRDDQG